MPVTAKYNASFNPNIYEYILRIDTYAYRSLRKFFHSIPGENRGLSGFLFLCLISLAIAGADLAVGWAISLRPLFVFPIILASIYLSRSYAYAIALVAALLRVETFRVTSLPEGDAFPFLLNFFPALLAYIALAEFGALATGTVRELLDYIDVLHEELAMERIAGLDIERVEEEEDTEA